MLTLDEIERWFDDTGVIITDISLLAGNLDRILHPRDIIEERTIKRPFFQHYLQILRSKLVLQLCKLFINQDKERRNFRKLFNRLKYDPYSKGLKNRLKENRQTADGLVYKREIIALLNKTLPLIEEKSEIIFKMKVLRDRQLAHTDPGKKVPELNDDQLLEMSQLAMEVYSLIFGSILGHSVNYKNDIDCEVEEVIRAMSTA